MTLNQQQLEALESIRNFMDSTEDSVFLLKGYAGTGKTTLLVEILKMAASKKIQCQVMAPTGRAAKIIRDKIGIEATTIHKGIYAFNELKELKDDKGFRLYYPLKINSGTHPLCIIDEASMISSMISKHEIYQCGTDILLNDLLTYAAPNSGGKIIFIGDPAQLPPVGDAHSMAFNIEYLNSLGLNVKSYELSQVMRQGNSAILKNASMVREKLHNELFNQLEYELKEDEVEIVQDIAKEFCSRYNVNSNENPVVITFSNKQAANYNQNIRNILFPGSQTVCSKDILLCVSNNYAHQETLYNGDFFRVVTVHPDIIQRDIPVYVEQAGSKIIKKTTLTFQAVEIQTSNAQIIPCYLITTLLYNKAPRLDISEVNALYVDFKIRHPQLKEGSDEFLNRLHNDPFFNAVQAKYGYAITGHKSQGGEWDDVFVDFSGQDGNSTLSLRWIYTVTTRAKKHLYSTEFPHLIYYDKFRMSEINIAKQFPEGFFMEKKNITEHSTPVQTPFYGPNVPDFIREKYLQINQNLSGTNFSIVNITSHQYLEKYSIQTPSGVFIYLGDYKKNKTFRFRSTPDCPENEQLLPLLNEVYASDEPVSLELNYVASTPILQELYRKMDTLCEQLDIDIVNIVEYPNSFFVRYSLHQNERYAYINFYFNNKGSITYGAPSSIINDQTTFLEELIKSFNE